MCDSKSATHAARQNQSKLPAKMLSKLRKMQPSLLTKCNPCCPSKCNPCCPSKPCCCLEPKPECTCANKEPDPLHRKLRTTPKPSSSPKTQSEAQKSPGAEVTRQADCPKQVGRPCHHPVKRQARPTFRRNCFSVTTIYFQQRAPPPPFTGPLRPQLEMGGLKKLEPSCLVILILRDSTKIKSNKENHLSSSLYL